MAPYAKVTRPPNAMQARYDAQSGNDVWLIRVQEIRAPIAPMAPNARLQHTRRPVEDDDPDAGQRVDTAESQARDDERLVDIEVRRKHRTLRTP